jgi:hypothetical protein
MTPRILIATPLLRSYGRAITAAHRLVRRAPCPVDWLLLPEQPYSGYDYRNVLYANERARDAALRGNYSHLLMLEDDMIPPPDTVERLLACHADVAYGLYCWRRGGRHLWSAYAKIEEGIGEPHQPGTLVQYYEAQAQLAVDGVGFGCTLIQRDILRRIPFRLPDDYDRGGACTDWMFALDCAAANALQVAHLGVVCGHISMDPSARVIWPEVRDGQPTHRYELIEGA